MKRTSFKKVWTYSYKGEFIETVMNEGCPAYVQKEAIITQKGCC